MIVGLIRWSIANRFLVLIATGFVALAGLYALRETPVDALPDLSDVQVIIKTSFPGQAPQVVEDQVTYPLTHHLRGRHGSLLGAVTGTRIPEPGVRTPAAQRQAGAGSRRYGRWLDIRICAG
jgi:hypothetical protein